MEQLEYLWSIVKSIDDNHLEKIMDICDISRMNWEFLSNNQNLTLKIVEKHIRMPWNWAYLSMNKNILADPNAHEMISAKMQDKIIWKSLSQNQNLTWDLVSRNLDKNWNWSWLSCHHNFGWEIIEKNLDKNWSWYILSRYLKLTPEIISNIRDISRIPWDWSQLSCNLTVTCDCISKNLDKDWDWGQLSRNPNITADFISKHLDKPWDWGKLSWNTSLGLDFIGRNLDKPWDWSQLSYHAIPASLFLYNSSSPQWRANNWKWISDHSLPYDGTKWYCTNTRITWGYIKNNLDKNWNWDHISAYLNITYEIISNNPDCNWNWSRLSENPTLTYEIVKRNPQKPWGWQYLSQYSKIVCDFVEDADDNTNGMNWSLISDNEHITWTLVSKHPEKPWDWKRLSGNPSINIEDIYDFATHPQHSKNISWKWLSCNPNITSDFIFKNLDKNWSWISMSRNLFNTHYEVKVHNRKIKAKYYHLALELCLEHIFPSEIILHIANFAQF